MFILPTGRPKGDGLRTSSSRRSGFTLVELMTATTVMGVLIAIVWGGLISVMESNRLKEAEIDRKNELNRAADFIATDIQEAIAISPTVTLPGPNSGVFELQYADGRKVAYFMRPQGTTRWKGPYVLYRRASDMLQAEALVDGIARDVPLCLAPAGQSKQAAGIRVIIQTQSYLKVCLAGALSEGKFLTVSRQVSVRNRT